MLGRPLIHYDTLSSTMTALGRLAALGSAEGTVVVADYQSAGRGRADRQWNAPSGSAVLASVLLRPHLALSQLSSLSILVGDAICAAMQKLYGVEPTIKWPNDVLIHGQKVSGVLIQTRAGIDTPAVIVGMGINANILPLNLPPTGTSLLAELGSPVDREELLRCVLDELEIRYRELLAGDLEHRWKRVQERLAMRNEPVCVVEGDTTVTGILRRVDADGALVLDTGETTRRVIVGDLIRGPRPLDPAGG